MEIQIIQLNNFYSDKSARSTIIDWEFIQTFAKYAHVKFDDALKYEVVCDTFIVKENCGQYMWIMLYKNQ